MRIAVVGVGAMGRNHVRILKNITQVSKIYVCDIEQKKLDATFKQFGIQNYYHDIDLLLEKEVLDGIILATPPDTHLKLAKKILAKKIPLLIEKPIARNIAEAEEIISIAEENNSLLTIGHTERFNPVISKIQEFMAEGILSNIYLINTRRVGPFPKRLLGNVEGVLIDLAVHDFDIIRHLGGSITNIKSQIIKSGNQEIYVKTLMDLENGIKASSEFSWITPFRERIIELYGSSGMIRADYFNQEVWFFENSDFKNNPEYMNSFLGSGLINACVIGKYFMMLI